MGKRTDQVRKDKLSTDYKERLDDPHINEEDKHELQSSKGEESLLPERGENPALEDLKARREQRQDEE